MANNVTRYNQPLPPAPAKSRASIEAGSSLRERFTAGITMPYPILSIRGKEFTLKYNGQENVLGNEVELILVNSSDKMNKAFYERGYDGGNDQPDCYSHDAIKPDPRAPHIQNVTCVGCQWNAFKSAKGQNGEVRPGKACADSRKLVLAFRNDLLGNQLGPIMLRLPVTSHQNLHAYVTDIARGGFEPNACTTKLVFDRAPDGSVLSYPKLDFIFGDALTDDEYELAMQWQHDERTDRILAAPPEGEQPSGEGVSRAQPIYNATMGGARSRPTPVPVDQEPRPTPRPAPRPEPTPEPPPIAASGPTGIMDIGGRAFNFATRKWVDEETQAEPDHTDPGQTGWQPPTSAPRYEPEVTQQVTSPRQRKPRTPPPQIEASANPEPQPEATPEPEPKANGKAQAAPVDLEKILGTMMPKRK